MLFDSGWNPLFSSDKIGHVQTTFTFKKPDRVRIRAFQNGVTISNVIVERADTYALTSGGASELLHRRHRAVLSLRVEADINSGYLYLGGFLGRLGAGRGTFQTVYFRKGA